MDNDFKIAGERLYLKPLAEKDITTDYLNGFCDDEVTAYLEVNGRSLTKESVLEYIENGRTSGNYFMFAIYLAHPEKNIGNLKIGPIDKKHGTSDLVTVIWDRSEWGKGLATEAIRLGNELAFHHFGIRKLSGGMYSGNIGSINAYTRAGWIIEGRLKDHYLVNDRPEDRVIVSCFPSSSEK